jgi:hypothetical protein
MARRPELVWLYSLAGAKVVPLHDLADLTVEDRLGDLEFLAFEIRAQDPKAGYLIADQLCTYAGRFYRVAEIKQQRRGPRTMIEVYAEARWMDLGKRKRAGVFSVLGRTPLQGLTQILTGTGWTVGSVPANPELYSIEDIDPTALSLIRRWAAVTGYEVEFDTVARTVSLVTQIGEDRGIGFRWGQNLLAVERRYEPPKATRLYAYGANNLTIEANNPSGLQYVEDYSWYVSQGLTLEQARELFRKDETWVDERYLLGLNLYDAALRRIAALAIPTVSYEVSVADLAELTSSPADDVEIGDLVRVRDQGFGIDLETRVVRIVRKPLDPQRNRVELDYLQPGLLDGDRSDSTRSIDYGALSVLVDQNVEELTVTSSVTTWGSIAVTVAGQSTFIAGGTFRGTSDGTGTVRFGLYLDGSPVGAEYDFAFTSAQQVEFSWPTMETGLVEGSYVVEWRARVVSGSGTIVVAAEEARAWLLARGAVGIGVNLSPNQLIAEVVDLIEDAAYTVPTETYTVTVTDIGPPPDGDPDLELTFSDTVAEIPDVDYVEPTEDITIDTPAPPGVSVLAVSPENYGAGSSITTISVDVPLESELGDGIFVGLMQQAGASDVTAPAGMTRVAQVKSPGVDHWTEIWQIDDDGTYAGTTLTFTTTVAGRLGIVCAVLRSDTGDMAIEDTDTTSGSTSTEAIPTSTTTDDDRLLLVFVSCFYANTSPTVTSYAAPTGWTRYTAQNEVDNRMCLTAVKIDAATVSGRSCTHGGSTHAYGSIALAIGPV